MIELRADSAKPTQTDEAEALAALQRILKSSPQELWLDTIRRTRIGRHDSLILWMLNQTECDFSVAANAFYHSNPAQYLDEPKPLQVLAQRRKIFAQVLLNWDKGYFRPHQFLVEPRDADPRDIAKLNQKAMARPRGSQPFVIPSRFLHPSGGERMVLPRHLSPKDAPHLWPIYTTLQLRVPASPPGLARSFAEATRAVRKFITRSFS